MPAGRGGLGRNHSSVADDFADSGPLPTSQTTDEDASIDATQFLSKTQFEEVQKQKYDLARGFVIEFLSYVMFLIVFMVVTYSFRSSWAFWNSEVVRQTLMQPAADLGFGPQLSNLRSVDDFWHYFENAFFPKMYPTAYEGSGGPLTDYDSKFMIEYNLRVGAMRWRQIRIKPEVNCSVDPAFAGFVQLCYPTMEDAREETEPFGPNNTFKWSSEADLCNTQAEKSFCTYRAVGLRGDSYPASGYIWDFTPNQTAFQELQYLKDNAFVNVSTRAVIIDFNLYNPNVYLMLACHVLIEFYPTGQLVTTSSVKAVPLMTLEVSDQVFELAGEILLLIFIVSYIVRETQEFLEHKGIKQEFCCVCMMHQRPSATQPQRDVECYICGRHFNPFEYLHCPLCQREIETTHICWKGYFLDPWNIIDIINLCIFNAVIIIRLHLRFLLLGFDYRIPRDQYLEFYPLALQYYLGSWLNSFNALLCFLKFFKYLARIKQLRVLVRALAIAGEELLYFVIIFFVIFIGFAMSFHMAFAGDVPEFAHWFTSCYSLFSLILGDFDYYALQQSNRVLAPIFFLSYMCLVWLVLVNMFVAIISGSYETAADDPALASDDFLSSSLKLFFRELRMKYFGWLFGENNKLHRVQRLLTAIEHFPGITEEQKDEVRSLQREIAHDANNGGLLSKILKEFPNKPQPVPIDSKDFSHLRRTVVEHKRLMRLERYKTSTFDVDEYDTLELMMNPAGHLSEEEAAHLKERLMGPDGNPLSAIDLVRQVQKQQHTLEKKVEDLLQALDLDHGPSLGRFRRLSQNSAIDGPRSMRSKQRRRKSSMLNSPSAQSP